MKNKGLIASVTVILLFLGATFVYQLGMRSGTNQASETSEPVEKAEKTVGILQFVSHEALDAISETTLNNAMAFTKGERTGNEVEIE